MAAQGLAAHSLGKHANSRRVRLRRASLVLLFSYAIASFLGGILLGEIALHPQRTPITTAEERSVREACLRESVEFEDARLVAADGVPLNGWFLRPAECNGNVVILLHGVTDNRLGMLGYGRMLLVHHYAVLLPDARAHGNSGGAIATYGFEEAADIHAWVNWLERERQPHCIFGLGESMGAAQLLQSLRIDGRLCGIVAESSFSTFRQVAYDRVGQPFGAGPWLGKTLFRPLIDVAFLYARMRYHVHLEEVSPVAAVARAHVPVLLIHGVDDRNIPVRHSETIRAANVRDVSIWEIPGAGHTGAYKTRPGQFEQTVINFFEEHSHWP
jgi:uncharacterized protein